MATSCREVYKGTNLISVDGSTLNFQFTFSISV